MSAREAILSAIRGAKPGAIAKPKVRDTVTRFSDNGNLVQRFTASAELAGARVVRGARSALTSLISAAYPDRGRRVSVLDTLESGDAEPHSFADTDVFVCEGVIGVAENGAVWLPLSRLRHRSAVFLAAKVIIVLDQTRIVADFHEAYKTVDIAADGFGVFMAGPSKTADIEQSLVVGAHGPKSLTIVLLDGTA
jgi:L-lactate dehydrogenase complex protein LldG